MTDEITLEHDIDQVLGLMTADGAESASLLDEAIPFAVSEAAEPEDVEDAEGGVDRTEDEED